MRSQLVVRCDEAIYKIQYTVAITRYKTGNVFVVNSQQLTDRYDRFNKFKRSYLCKVFF